jgi:hypothetical protein
VPLHTKARGLAKQVLKHPDLLGAPRTESGCRRTCNSRSPNGSLRVVIYQEDAALGSVAAISLIVEDELVVASKSPPSEAPNATLTGPGWFPFTSSRSNAVLGFFALVRALNTRHSRRCARPLVLTSYIGGDHFPLRVMPPCGKYPCLPWSTFGPHYC